METVKVGQILWLKIRFNNLGEVSTKEHPYLVLDIFENSVKVVEIGQLDSLKPYKLIYKANKPIYYTNPVETVISKDSYIQLDNKLQIEYFDDLKVYLKTQDTLSEIKLTAILFDYKKYHENNLIDPQKTVYMTKDELLQYNA